MFFQQKQFFSDKPRFELKYETFPFIEAILGPFLSALSHTEGLNPITYFCDPVKQRNSF